MDSKSIKRRVSEAPDKAKAEETLADVEMYSALDAVATSEGGKLLIESLTTDALDDIDTLCEGYRKLPHAELIALCASLEKSLSTLRSLTRAGKQKKLAREMLEQVIGD